ncbi:MAG: cupin domain-containing protein [Alphaproteobacteria bacterium]|nr:cupin domain-containing protein [Alphaproteobacteria bacterium]MBT5160113.1 cupin domain-containing protein [Alphaproteobacteria bacterium]MBT5917530.1 cupin domain-containing protein [Alphaproteobacteria bacterium]MBT6385908.1 cupin domain-containing protein [Alphaproteobacteria bacterium]
MSISNQTDKYAPAGFAKGKLSVAHEKDAEWDEGLREYFAYRDLDIFKQTGGKMRAHVIRPTKPGEEQGDKHFHKVDFQMVYVLKGWALMHFDGVGEVRLEEGSCMYQEPEIEHRLIEWSDDYTVIELLVPGDPETISTAP